MRQCRRLSARGGHRRRGAWPLFHRRGASSDRRQSCRWRLPRRRSEEHTSELQSHSDLVCRLLLEKKNDRSLVDHARSLLLSKLMLGDGLLACLLSQVVELKCCVIKRHRSAYRDPRISVRGQYHPP